MLKNFDFRINDVVSFNLNKDKRRADEFTKGRIISLSDFGRWANIKVFKNNEDRWIESIFLEDLKLVKRK